MIQYNLFCNSVLIYMAISVFIVVSYSCDSTYDSRYFNGDIVLYEDNLQLETLRGEQIFLNGLHTGRMDVCDSLIFMQYFGYSDYFISIFNHYTGKHLGNFLSKGNGPGEYVDLSWIYQFFYEDGNLKGLLYSYFKKKIIIWNITESLNAGITCADQIDISESEAKGIYGGYMFFANSEYLVARVRSHEPSESSNQTYHKIDLVTQEIKYTYSLYNKLIDNNDNVFRTMYQHTPMVHNIKGTKLSSSMAILHQINILDIETGVQRGFRMKYTPNFKNIADLRQTIKFHYLAITADTQYIYALYVGEETDFKVDFPKGQIIHIFDWNGNFVRKLHLDKEGSHIGIDAKNHVLLIKNDSTDEIYKYSLK